MSVVMPDNTAVLEPVARLSRDIRTAAGHLGDAEARYLVDAYYIMQDDRKRAFAQERALGVNAEPNAVISWLAEQSATLENQIKAALNVYTNAHPMGSFMRSTYGVGPVISAGLLAHIDITKCPTVGHVWQFAGIAGDGQKPWEKGSKRPFNAQLKTLCWKLGQSFMKFSNQPECIYGHHYRQQKDKYIARNVADEYKDRALARAAKVGKSTEAYKHYSVGKLPPGHIDAMARRWAVKRFLADLHMVWYWIHYHKLPPLPYPIAIQGHAHYDASPIRDNMPDLWEALIKRRTEPV